MTITLPLPIVCECGFATMDAAKAIQHIKDKHPELWDATEQVAEEQEDFSNALG